MVLYIYTYMSFLYVYKESSTVVERLPDDEPREPTAQGNSVKLGSLNAFGFKVGPGVLFSSSSRCYRCVELDARAPSRRRRAPGAPVRVSRSTGRPSVAETHTTDRRPEFFASLLGSTGTLGCPCTARPSPRRSSLARLAVPAGS